MNDRIFFHFSHKIFHEFKILGELLFHALNFPLDIGSDVGFESFPHFVHVQGIKSNKGKVQEVFLESCVRVSCQLEQT